MLNIESDRTKKLINNVLGASFYKGINIVFSFLLVRYSIEFIGEEQYGVWLTLLSFFTWFSALEVGISNSLRNQLTQYFVENQFEKVKKLLLKGYKALIMIYLPLIGLLIVLSFFIPVEVIFMSRENSHINFNFIFQISLVCYVLHYVFFFLHNILLSTHFTKTTYLITAVQNGLLLFGVILIKHFNFPSSLLLFCLLFSAAPLLVWSFFNLFSFTTFLKKIKPNVKDVFIEKIRPFKGMNKSFFVMQICTLVIFSTDNLIVANQLSGTEVSKYNIVFKYFNILIVFFNLVLLPYWASFAEAAHQKDKKWIQSNIKRLVMIWCCIALLAIVMVLLSNTVYKLWIGKDLEISTSLSLTMCISILLTAWYNIFGYFLNGISETKLQTKILIISALFNLPLSFLLLNYFESTGVILATCIALIPLGILLPLQYRSIIKQMI